MLAMAMRKQHSLDLDDVFDDDVTMLANGSCRFIYANVTDACRNCALAGRTCSPVHVVSSGTRASMTSARGRQALASSRSLGDGIQTCPVRRTRSSSTGRNVRFSDSIEYNDVCADCDVGTMTMPVRQQNGGCLTGCDSCSGRGHCRCNAAGASSRQSWHGSDSPQVCMSSVLLSVNSIPISDDVNLYPVLVSLYCE